MSEKIKFLTEKLKDERSKKVVFISHCILNENTRYFGGAFRKGCVDEVIDELKNQGIGIIQMSCPEQRAWGGVLKRHLLRGVSSKNMRFYKYKKIFLPVFVWNTKRVFRKISKEIVKDIEDYLSSGFEVIGIVGVDGSPSCGVNFRLDMKKSVEFIANVDIDNLNRADMNEFGIENCIINGEGWFIEVLKKELRRRDIEIKFYAHDLRSEIKDDKIKFTLL